MCVPKAVVSELRALGDPVEEALVFVQTHCEVLDDASAAKAAAAGTPADAIRALVGARNPGRYLVATQEEELRTHLRGVPGVPLFHLQRLVLILEGPSAASRRAGDRVESDKLGAGAADAEAIRLAQKLRLQERAEKRRSDGAAAGTMAARKKPKAKGPNPLSCMKKRGREGKASPPALASGVEGGAGAAEQKKRRRRKKGGGTGAVPGDGGDA